MRLEAVFRTLTDNKVVSRVWVVAIVPAGVAMTVDQIHAVWRARMPPPYGAATDYARIIGCAKSRGAKAPNFKLFEDDPQSRVWVEYIEHPNRPPIEIPAAPLAPARTTFFHDEFVATTVPTTPF